MKRLISVNLMLILAGIISIVYYFAAFESISENVVRLHIIPNSNSEYDINVKNAVRDEILRAMQGEITKDTPRSEIIKSGAKTEELANNFLITLGAEYGAEVKTEKTHIVRKSYNGITMPEGEYTAIKVILGEGGGENWWCVAYPPLCFTEDVFGKLSEDGKEQLKESMSRGGYSIVDGEIRYELKLVEIAEKIMEFIKSK